MRFTTLSETRPPPAVSLVPRPGHNVFLDGEGGGHPTCHPERGDSGGEACGSGGGQGGREDWGREGGGGFPAFQTTERYLSGLLGGELGLPLALQLLQQLALHDALGLLHAAQDLALNLVLALLQHPSSFQLSSD